MGQGFMGIFYGGHGQILLNQFIAVCVIAAWSVSRPTKKGKERAEGKARERKQGTCRAHTHTLSLSHTHTHFE